ncbi:diamine N-acetyltransferase [Catalinimonas alkaloidigena]|uniref:Diamine N-acetyltransferase n=1 Tax=Catalinimonas alkaloidigena TaxID=1075417 RepID=A0A1G9RPH6_9BACT|nr:GNAT family N-acetyltransferase [Catalinimonas alkaloidigena]SDM25198.1 diamine N-acetyltransferase [Catalinimonas alkaloidigena]
MPFTIRRAHPADFEVLYALMLEFAHYLDMPGKLTTSPEQLRRDQDIFRALLVEDDDGTPIGFATYFYAYYSWSGKALYLDDLYIRATHRGHGLGATLLDRVIEVAREAGCRQMRWLVLRANQDAIAFYQKKGATVDDTDLVCTLDLT